MTKLTNELVTSFFRFLAVDGPAASRDGDQIDNGHQQGDVKVILTFIASDWLELTPLEGRLASHLCDYDSYSTF